MMHMPTCGSYEFFSITVQCVTRETFQTKILSVEVDLYIIASL
jgi:hypothetical protein